MEKEHLVRIAETNLELLASNSYPGRIIIMGMNEEGTHLLQLYAIMGRSSNSRNRLFVVGENGVLKTEAADSTKVQDPSLIIYDAMLEEGTQSAAKFAVSNGAQTEDILKGEGITGEHFENKWKYEPDNPNFTSRISSYWYLYGPPSKRNYVMEMSLLKKSPFSEKCNHEIYAYNDIMPGFGYCMHTYDGNADPLPSFSQTPYLVSLKGTTQELLDELWTMLDDDNKISLAIKQINIETRKSEIVLVNKYERVEAMVEK